MALKRLFGREGEEEGLGVHAQLSKKRLLSKTVRDFKFIRRLTEKEIEQVFEPFLRTVVREEIDRVISPLHDPLRRPLLNPINTSSLQLRFSNQWHPTYFTNCKIESDDGSPIKVELFDTITGSVVQTGPLSSMRIQVVVLDGDFGGEEHEDWTDKEFTAHVVREREGRRPLVIGELSIYLREGVCYLGNVMFTDNSSWVRSGQFRLGARADRKIFADTRIREARSEKFKVLDQRGGLYKKHFPPSAKDEVWRLKNIAKDGRFHKRLASYGIHTVRDFIRRHETDPAFLRKILHTNTSKKKWEAIVEHASTCVPDDNEFYIYHGGSLGASLLFNSIYKVIGLTFDGKTYHSPDDLVTNDKVLVQNLKQRAYLHVDDLKPTKLPSIAAPPRALHNHSADASIELSSCGQQVNLPISCQGIEDFKDQLETLPGFNQSLASTSYNNEAAGSQHFKVSVSEDYPPMQAFNCTTTRNMQTEFYSVDNSSPYTSHGLLEPSGLLDAIGSPDFAQIQALCSFPSSYSSLAQTAGDNVFLSSLGEAEVGILSSFPSNGVHIHRNPKSKACWCKIRAAFKWRSVRRDVAAKRTANLPFIDAQGIEASPYPVSPLHSSIFC